MSDFSQFQVSVGQNLLIRGRRYNGGTRTPALCIPGLTRNAGDFDDLAPAIAKTGRDVIVVNLRGRGPSDYDPNYLNYHPHTYRDDILRILDDLDIPEAIFVGTSLGGIVTMLTNEHAPARVKAAILNDIGPELAPEGIMRIAAYVGKSVDAGPAATIEEAAARIKAINAVAFPDSSDEDWIIFAHRTFKQTDDGKWVLEYDPNISRALREVGAAPDLWPAFESLKDTPTLVLRGGLSDLLSLEIIEKMRAVHPGFDYCEVLRIGHAPMMTEPAAWNAVKEFLGKVD